ncbi:hypothetical protein [Mycobacteroides abscessus]|uniref:hypothetical protein n=1 Tax=Mycobacteroides abscessus TaxID=36809 RepID=UPI0002585680|nr:hypothetical protein [Mycobacteroides abscessus]EIC63559.1 hypothetical protein OUW_20286 [Mycobacteroides abscessus M93]
MSGVATLEQLTDHSPFRQKVNRDLMVAWINADLVNRAWGDVRTSTVFYDEAKVFVTAQPRNVEFSDRSAQALYDTGIRYWSEGVR